LNLLLELESLLASFILIAVALRNIVNPLLSTSQSATTRSFWDKRIKEIGRSFWDAESSISYNPCKSIIRLIEDVFDKL